jgi:hypothetical protein
LSQYGFRPGRGCHDAIEAIFHAGKGKHPERRWALDADLAGAFDRIAHNYVLAMLGSFPARGMVAQWLKAGVGVRPVLRQVQQGQARPLGIRRPRKRRPDAQVRWTNIVRHPIVMAAACPDDPALNEYWAGRRRKAVPPINRTARRLHKAHDGRCAIGRAPVLSVEDRPQTPREREARLTATRKTLDVIRNDAPRTRLNSVSYTPIAPTEARHFGPPASH